MVLVVDHKPEAAQAAVDAAKPSLAGLGARAAARGVG